jgi:hypothetical protein
MTDIWSVYRRGLAELNANPPTFLSVLAVSFAFGAFGAAVVGLVVGFHDTEDGTVGAIRFGGALLTGFMAGLVGRGIRGWVAASAGATLAGLPFVLPLDPDPSIALGWAMFSYVILAPGYAVGRILTLALRLPTMNAEGRSAALRMPLRRTLRLGVVVSGGVAFLASLTAGAFLGTTGMALGGVVGFAGFGASFALYRLIDRLDRGESRPALVFTMFYSALGLGWFGLLVAADAPLAWAIAESALPSSFMALAPWLLVDVARQQRPASADGAEPPRRR